MSKFLIIYYSRTGVTEKVARALALELGADMGKIQDEVNRRGLLGYLRSGREAAFKSLPAIKPVEKNLADYDWLIIGTPVWAHSMASPVRVYLHQNKNAIRRLACFCTMAGSGGQSALRDLEKISGHKIEGHLIFKSREVLKNEFFERVKSFAKALEASVSVTP